MRNPKKTLLSSPPHFSSFLAVYNLGEFCAKKVVPRNRVPGGPRHMIRSAVHSMALNSQVSLASLETRGVGAFSQLKTSPAVSLRMLRTCIRATRAWFITRSGMVAHPSPAREN